jgi:CO/xanthine dehydrogenase Mo-binding subunit
MPGYKLIGQNYTTPDLVAKVTGRAKYAEDFRAEGMLFCKLLLSPMPHARVTHIDTTAALGMPGVKAILTADDLPPLPGGAERALTNEPLYEGEPILAVAAVDELTAAEAIERIEISYEQLPFVIDPVRSLREGGQNARTEGNVWFPAPAGAPGGAPPRPEIKTIKWNDVLFSEAGEGVLPMGETSEQWQYGDVDAAFKSAALVMDESFVVPSTGHQPMETRTAMAYWSNGRLYLHGSTQSVAQTVDRIATWVGIKPEDVVLISAYCGGGFGSKGAGAVSMSIPAVLSKKASAPVMMRITREDEYYIGRARTGVVGRARAAFASDGRMLGLDLLVLADNGPYGPMGDHRSAANAASLIYQPGAMRFRGMAVLTNTPPRSQQRSPGPMQANGIVEPLLTKAAKALKIDQAAIRRLNSPEGKALYGPARPNGTRAHVTSAFVKEAIDRGVTEFDWETRKARSGTRVGSKVRGVGLAVGPHGAGSIGFDSLMIITPDGRLRVHSGIGNLGTHSVIDIARVAADVLRMPWEKVDVVWGDTSKGLPWTCMSVGSQTTHAMTRANHAGASDLKRKLQEIAATDLGGAPDEYDVAGERVFRINAPARGMTLAQAASRAIALGGTFDGHELPDDINPFTKRAASPLAGQGVMGVAKDTYPRDGDTYSFVVGFAEVEVDVETGKTTIVDYLAVADVGTIVNPRSLRGQILGGSILGLGHGYSQKWQYDQHYGVPVAKRFYQNRPMTILDVPANGLNAIALNLPDPETPVGARGVGEPPVGAGFGAILNAISDAVGVDVFRRAPVTADIVLTSLESERRTHEELTVHI